MRSSRSLKWSVPLARSVVSPVAAPLTCLAQAESITEGTLKQWSKQVGDFVKQDEEIATIETDKVSDVSHFVPSRIFPPHRHQKHP
jgi:hypothetical protein